MRTLALLAFGLVRRSLAVLAMAVVVSVVLALPAEATGIGKIRSVVLSVLDERGITGASTGTSSTPGSPNFDALTIGGATTSGARLEVNSGILTGREGDDSAGVTADFLGIPRALSTQVNSVAVTSVATAHTYTVPAGTLAADGDYLEYEVTGANTGGTVSLTIAVTLGTTDVATFGASSAQTWRIVGRVYRTGASAQYTTFLRTAANTANTGEGTGTEALSGALVLKSHVLAYANGTATFNSFAVRLVKAVP